MTSPMVPVSLFRSIYDTGYSRTGNGPGFYCGINQTAPWDWVCELLSECSRIPFPNKASAPLFSPTVYLCRSRPHVRGYHCKENATTSGMAVIDADSGLMYSDVVNLLATCGLEAVCYTSARNRDGDRFRIVIPLSETVEPVVHTTVVVAICRFLAEGWEADRSKNYSYMKFYLPGQYAGADNQFIHLRGEILPPAAWYALGDQSQVQKVIDPPRPKVSRPRCPGSDEWSIETHCADYIEDYLAVGSNRYREHFRTMVRVAMRAIRNGCVLSTGELAAFGDYLYAMNPGKSKHKNMEREAENALAYAATTVSPPAAIKSRWREGLGPQTLDEFFASINEAHTPPPPPLRKGPSSLEEYIASLSSCSDFRFIQSSSLPSQDNY